MTLKAFHIFFIAVSALLAFGFGIWGLHSYFEHTNNVLHLWLGIASLVIGGVLIVYGIKIYQKLQTL